MNRRPHDMLGRRNEQLVEGFCVQTWHEGERDAQGGRRNVQLAGTEGMEWVSRIAKNAIRPLAGYFTSAGRYRRLEGARGTFLKP